MYMNMQCSCCHVLVSAHLIYVRRKPCKTGILIDMRINHKLDMHFLTPQTQPIPPPAQMCGKIKVITVHHVSTSS